MAKKSLSTKRSLKSLFSKSEANLEESAGNDGGGGDGGKTLKLLKWKKKKKTEPQADKTDERPVSQNELDSSGTALDGDGVNWSNGGDRKKLSIYGTARRSKKGSLSYSETDLRKPRKFGTFSFAWKKKGKQRATDLSQSTMGQDTPQELEEEQEDDLEGSVENPENPPCDPVHGTERRVRFEFSEPEPPGPQVTLSPPSGPTDQSKLREAMTNSPDVPDGGMAQGSAPSAPDALWQASGMVPSRVIGQEWQEVQVNGPDEPAPLSSVHKEVQVSATSAAIAALTRAQSVHHGLPTTPPPRPPLSVPAVAVTPVRSPFPKTDLPQANTSLLKDEISEMAAPISALSGPVFSNTDPSTPVSDISIPDSDLSVAVKDTDTSLPNIDLPDEVSLPNTVTVVPKSEVYDTVIPDSDTSLRNTRLSDTTAPNIDTPSPKIEVPGTVVPGTDTPLKNTDTVALNTDTSLPYITDLSDTVASKIEVIDTVIPYTDTSLKSTDLSDTNDPTTYTPLPNTDPSVTIGSSLPKSYISNIDTTLPNTVFSDNVVHNTETSSAKSEVWGRAISNTSLVYTDPFQYTDAVSPNVDSSLSKNEISYTVAHDPALPNTDVVTPNIDTPLRNADFSDTVSRISDFLNTDLSNSFSPNTDISPPNTGLSDTVEIRNVPLPDINHSDFSYPNTEVTDVVTPNMDTLFRNTDFSATASPNIRSSHFNPEFSDTVAQISDFLNTDFSNSFSPNTDISPPNNTDPGFPNTGRSIVRADTSDIIVPKWDSSFPKADLSEPFGTSGDTFLPSETEVSYVITPNPGVSDPVVTKTGLSPANAETFQPTNFGLSNIEVLDRNGNDPFTKYDSYNSDHTSNSNRPLPEVDLKADWPRPGLSTENLNPFRPKAYDSYERSYERSYPYTLDHNENDILTVGVSDIANDRQDAGIQEDKVDGDPAAAETGRRGEGGLEQGREDRRRREEREERGILKRAELADVTVEGEALKEGGEWGRGLQQEDFGVLGQKEWLKGEVEEVEWRPQVPVTEPDSPVPQERAPQECEPTPPSPTTTEGEGLPPNWSTATEERPSVLTSEEKTPERADRWATNAQNAHTERVLIYTVKERARTVTDTVTGRAQTITDTVEEEVHTATDTVEERAQTATDTVEERAHTATDTVEERAHTLTDRTEGGHTLADTVTERADSTHTSTCSDTPTATEDPQPSLTSVNSADQAGRFLDDLSGPWGTVEESVSPQAPEDQDMMNSGYGILNTTLNAKAAQARDVKEDGRLRFQKVSLVSSYGDRSEDRSSSPAELHYDRDRGTTGTVIQRDILSREDRSVPDPSLTSSGSLQRFGSDSPGSLKSFYSAASLDTLHPSSPGAYWQAGFSTLSPEEPGSHGNSHSFGERSEVQPSREPEPGGRGAGAEPAAPAEERAREAGINSGWDSQSVAERSLSPVQTDGPLSGVFTATLVELLPSPTSPDAGSPYDMDTFVDTLRSMDRTPRRVSRPPPLSAVTSLPPIVEDSPVPGPKALNGPAVLPADLGLKWSSPKDLVSPLEMMKRRQEVDGPDQRSRPLPLRASADSSIVFRRTAPGSPSGNGAASPQLNGSSSPGPSRLDGSLLFSSYLQENGKSPSGRSVMRASSLPDAGPSRVRISSAPSLPGAEAQAAASSRYERFSSLMSPPSSLAEVPEPARISLPPSLSHNPLGELGFSSVPSSPSDVIRSPTTDPLSKLQRSLSVDSPFASQVLADVQWASHLAPQPEPVRPAVTKYRAFPDAYLTKEKEHGKLNPRPGKMFIYTDPDLCGERIEVRSDIIDTTSWDLPETVYIRVVRGGWVLYEKPNFKGEKFPLDEEDIELTCPFTSPEEGQEKEGEREVEGEEEVKSKPSRKCVIGSLRRAVRDYSVPEISLFPEENAEGKKVVFRDTSEDARIFGFPVKASSIIIKTGLWLVYAHPFMQGIPRVLEVGGYPNPAAWGVDKPYVGSVHPLKIGEPKVEKPHEPKLVIFDKPYFTGKSRDVYTHLREFLTRTDMKQTAFMSSAGSIKVVGGCWVGYSKENFRGNQYLLEEGDYHDWRVWGGCDAELRSIRLIRADFSEPMLVMIAQPEEEEEVEEERTFEVTEATPDVELFNFPTSTSSIHVLSGAWIAYSHVDFSGNQYVLEKGFYSNSGDWGATDNRICSLQPILLAPTETPTSRSEVLLYSEPDFQGQCQQCQENQESLPEKFTSKSCRVLRGSWVVYEGREYSGNLYILPEGDYPNLNSMGCPPSCSLRSLKIIPLVFAVPSISLFGLECFEGRQVTLDTEISSLMDEGFNNHVLSIRVNSGSWVACEHTNYRGRQILLEPIEISNWLKFSGLPTIGSMYPVRQKRHFFRIKNQERGHVMSIQGGVEEMKSGRVVVTEQVEGMSDIWYYQDGLIKNKLAPSMCLQVMGEVEPGSKVVLWSETRQPIQVWTTQTSGIIANMTFPGMVLDIKGGKTYDRNHVIIYAESEERPSQQWEIELL